MHRSVKHPLPARIRCFTVSENLTFEIYPDEMGEPSAGPPIHTFNVGNTVSRSGTGMVLTVDGPRDLFSYSADIAPTTLDAGTTYWLSIFNDMTQQANTDSWGWGIEIGAGNHIERTGSGPWTRSLGSPDLMDFRLTDDNLVPEPTTAALVVLGLLGAGYARRRRVH